MKSNLIAPTPTRSYSRRIWWIVVAILALFGAGLNLFRARIVRSLRNVPAQVDARSPHLQGAQVDYDLPQPDATFGLRLGLRFQVPPSARPGVLLQTATSATGLTLKYSGQSLSVTLPNDHGDPTGGTFGGPLAPAEWHDLALNGEFGSIVKITLDGKLVYTGPFQRPEFTANRLHLGSDLAGLRGFDGQITAPHLDIIGPRETALSDFILGRLLLAGLMVVIIVKMYRASPASPCPTALPAKGPIDYLLLVRALACGLVLFGHILLVVFPPRTLSADMGLLYRILAPCPWVGVWMFFTLSGYLMGKGFYSGRYHLDSARIAAFYRNRALRIVPLYFAAVLLVAAFKTRELFEPNRIWNLADILSFGSNGDPICPIGALWAVSTEVQFYLMVPILVFLLFAPPLRKPIMVTLLLAAIACLGLIARRGALNWLGAPAWNSMIYTPVLSNLDLFAFGLLLNPVCDCFRSRISTQGLTKFLLFVIVTIAGYSLMVRFTLPAMVNPRPSDFFAMVGFAPTITAAITGALIFIAEAMTVAGRESRRLRNATALGCRVGLFSYSIYVWHEPIILGMRHWFPTTLSEHQSFAALLVCLPTILVAAAVSYFLIEVPFERFKIARIFRASAPAGIGNDPVAN